MQKEWTRSSLAKTIDHTLLKAIATEQSIRELCAEARKYGFASVCINPYWVGYCAKELAGSDILVCTVIGFPLGASASATKASEAKLAVSQGAREIDMVINLGAIKSGDWRAVEEDIRGVVQASGNAAVKVIIETCYPHRGREDQGLRGLRVGGRPLREDEHGFRDGRRHGGGHPADAQDGGRKAPDQGLRRRAQLRRRNPHARGRRRSHRRELQRRHRHRAAGIGLSICINMRPNRIRPPERSVLHGGRNGSIIRNCDCFQYPLKESI